MSADFVFYWLTNYNYMQLTKKSQVSGDVSVEKHNKGSLQYE